jgi:tRNA pseudouridine55 synthase
VKGILLVDKPPGITSHDVVDHVRKAAGIRRVGHTGTLDPRATGLLILCVGGATRLSEHLTALDKTYEGTMRLGIVTDSFDLDGAVLEQRPVPELTADDVQQACDRYTGDIEQIPPMVSAVKIGGQRLYKMARQGETVERKPRPVKVHEFSVLGYAAPDAHIRVRCTSGTYVRSLCHDVGAALGCGAALACLRRTWVGSYCVDKAVPLGALTNRESVEAHLTPIHKALDMPEVIVRPACRKMVVAGSTLTRRDCENDCPVESGWVQIKTASGELLALGLVKPGPAELCIHPKRVLGD